MTSRMTKRLFTFVAIGLLLAIPVYCLIWPNTPEARFRWETGIELPDSAVLVDDIHDYTVGMQDSFASEGTSLLLFKVDQKTTSKILNSPAPWKSTWERGSVPVGVNAIRPSGNMIFMAETGDSGNGHMLAVDSEKNQLWLFGWDW